mmetsp:Transcript_48132/g.93993  ORF Transcript_48132/g.93993 Transcript_48132/m.93993 type:complete len:184 (-) Transcript_48132:152-703(-)
MKSHGQIFDNRDEDSISECLAEILAQKESILKRRIGSVLGNSLAPEIVLAVSSVWHRDEEFYGYGKLYDDENFYDAGKQISQSDSQFHGDGKQNFRSDSQSSNGEQHFHSDGRPYNGYFHNGSQQYNGDGRDNKETFHNGNKHSDQKNFDDGGQQNDDGDQQNFDDGEKKVYAGDENGEQSFH